MPRQTKKHRTRDDRAYSARTSPVKRAQNIRGLLSGLVKMPMDILFEIFGLLEPLDLVNISRTTKALRAILMSRSSVSIWRSARSSIFGLPDCPDDLSEPQYAILMFVTKCSFCQKTATGGYISWYGRFRCCKKCVQLNFVKYSHSPAYLDRDRCYPYRLAQWLPCVRIPRTGKRSIFESENADVIAVFPDIDAQWKDEYCAIAHPIERYSWIFNKLEACYTIQKHALACALWHKATQNSANTNQIREVFKRNGEIMDYIQKTIGWNSWEEDLYKLSPRESNPLDMATFQDLWNPLGRDIQWEVPKLRELKNLLSAALIQSSTFCYEADLREFFKARKILLSAIYNNCVKMLPITSPYPTLAQFYHLAKEHNWVNYSKPAEEALCVPFDKVIALWRKHVDDKLVELIAKECGPEYMFDPDTVLDLATTLFVCSGGDCFSTRPPMRRDHAMVHHCQKPRFDEARLDTEYQRECYNVFGYPIWSGIVSAVQFRKASLKLMQEVVEMCGLDPKVTTARQMDELDPVFECRACNSAERGRAMLSWVSVLRHQRAVHGKYDVDREIHSHTLRILSEPEASKAREGIKEEHARSTDQVLEGKLTCPYNCKSLSPASNLKDYQKHMKEQHARSEVNVDELTDWVRREWPPPMYRLWPPLEEESSDKA